MKEGLAALKWRNILTKFRVTGLIHSEFKSGNSQMTHSCCRSIFFR